MLVTSRRQRSGFVHVPDLASGWKLRPRARPREARRINLDATEHVAQPLCHSRVTRPRRGWWSIDGGPFFFLASHGSRDPTDPRCVSLATTLTYKNLIDDRIAILYLCRPSSRIASTPNRRRCARQADGNRRDFNPRRHRRRERVRNMSRGSRLEAKAGIRRFKSFHLCNEV